MNGLCAALIILLVLVLIGQIRIGARVEYDADGLVVWVRAGLLQIPVFPVKAKGNKKQRTQKTKAATDKTAKPKKGGHLKLVFQFIPLLLDTVKRFRRKLQVDKLDISLTVCGGDPADAALRYGQANALLGALWQPLVQALHVKDGNARVAVDFDADTTTIYILASASLTIAQAVALAVVFGWKALGILIQNRTGRHVRTERGERRFNHGTQASY